MISNARSGSRFPVGSHHRAIDERSRDGHALLLPSRQFRRVGVHPILKADPLQGLLHPASLHRFGLAHHAKHERGVLGHGHPINQLEVLKDEPHVTAIRLGLSGPHQRQTFTVHGQLSRGRPLLTQQEMEQRRLPGPTGAGQEHKLALAYLQRQVVERVNAKAVRLGNVKNLNRSDSAGGRGNASLVGVSK
jgi:hypothetical protein